MTVIFLKKQHSWKWNLQQCSCNLWSLSLLFTSSQSQSLLLVTWWPLLELKQLTKTAQSFPPILMLPDPAGFDINTRPWLTTLALGWIPGVSKVHWALLLPVDLLFSVATRWSISPLSLLTGQPENLSPSNIFALWFPKELIKKKQKKNFFLHLFRLMCAPVQAGCSRQLGNKGKASMSQASIWIFYFLSAQAWSGPCSRVCQFNVMVKLRPQPKPCSMCSINMCGEYLCNMGHNMELTFIRQMWGNLCCFLGATCRCGLA